MTAHKPIVLVIRTGNKTTTSDLCICEFDSGTFDILDTTWIECKKDITFSNIWTPTFKIGYDETTRRYSLSLNNKHLQTRAPEAYQKLNAYFNQLMMDKQCHSDPEEFSRFVRDMFMNKNDATLKSDAITISEGFGEFLDLYFVANENDYKKYNIDYMIIGSGVSNGKSRDSICLKLNPDKDLLTTTNGRPFATSFETVFANGIKVQLRQRQRDGKYVEVDCDIMAKVFPDVGTIF